MSELKCKGLRYSRIAPVCAQCPERDACRTQTIQAWDEWAQKTLTREARKYFGLDEEPDGEPEEAS